MYMQAFLANLLVGRFFGERPASADFRANNSGFVKIVRLCENFLTTGFGWKILHLQYGICFNRSNYAYTITMTTNRFLNVF